MRSSAMRAAVAVSAVVALAVTGCSGASTSSGGSAQGPGATGGRSILGKVAPADSRDQGTPRRGGTLRLAGKGDVDHLDTASGYYSVTYGVMRAFTRQLVSYPNSPDLAPTGKANQVVADAATEVPTPTDGGRTYTFHIRQGVKWHAPSGDRQVTAQDFVLGFKRLCNPVSPTGAPGYFEPTIAGMQAYCDGFEKVAQTVPAIKSYITSHQIAGVTAADAQTLVIKLTAPVADFLNILAMPFCSAVPVEYLDYLPDSPQFRQHTISDGPYVITSYKAKQSMRLDRNPAWDASTDPLRKAYVDSMQVTMGVSEEAVAQQLQAGTTDLFFSSVFPVSDVRKVRAANDPKLGYAPTGDTWYIDMNLQSPNQNGALRKRAVRQALNYAVDKQHVIQQLGGPSIAAPQDTILTPTLVGFSNAHPYGTKPNIGKAKQLLRQAGYPNGLTLKFLYPTDATREVQIFTVLQQDYKAADITLKAVPVATTDEFYASYLEHPHAAKSGVWDLALPGWIPDWAGNGARSIFVPLLDGRRYGEGSTNYGDYSNPAVDKLVDTALHETDRATEAGMLTKADAIVMRDAPWVPLYTEFYPTYHSARIRGYVYFPEAYNADFTNVWLAS